MRSCLLGKCVFWGKISMLLVSVVLEPMLLRIEIKIVGLDTPLRLVLLIDGL